MDSFRLGIMIPFWHNPNGIAEIIAGYYQRLKVPGVELVFVGVLSPNPPTPFNHTRFDRFRFVETRNEPVSNKFNFGMFQLKRLNVDAGMYCGADDLINERYIRQGIQWIKRGKELVKSGGLFFYDVWTQRAFHTYSTNVGACAIYSRRALEKVGYKPFPSDLNSGIDSNIELRMKGRGVRGCGVIRVDPTLTGTAVLLDVKMHQKMPDGTLMQTNIHNYACMRGGLAPGAVDQDAPEMWDKYFPDLKTPIFNLTALLT